MLLACSVSAKSVRQFQVQFLDEFERPITTITSITVFNAGLGTSPTIYADRGALLTMTNPITSSSTNSTFLPTLGLVTWFQTEPDYKITVTDGTKTLTVDNRNEGNTQFAWYDNYIGTAASLSVSDNQSITVGTDSDMVLSWVNASNFMSWIPAADGSAFNLGTSGTGANVDFNWFVGTALGIKGDEGAATLIIDGLTTSINASSNFNTNINTGTSTGAVTIGSSTAGAITVDSTSTVTMNSDGAFAITTSDGSADITLDATAGSVNLVSGEDAAAAISLVTNVGVSETIVITNTQGTSESALNIDAAAGGIDIDFATAKNMAIDGGQFIFTSNEDVAGAFTVTANTGSSETIVLTNTQGTAESAFNIDATAGGIDIDFATAKNMAVTGGQFIFTSNEDVASAFSVITNTGTSETITIVNTLGSAAGAILLDAKAGGVDINATGATDGDMTVDVGDDYTVTVTGDYTLAVTGTTTLPGNQLRRVSVAIADTEMDNLAATPKELVAAVPGSTIEFISAVIGLDWGSTAWTEPSAPDDLVVRFENGTGAIASGLLDATGFATATEDTYAHMSPVVASAAGAALASVAVTEANSTNKALVLHNTGSEWTNSGDSQVVVVVYYRLHTTAELGL